MLTLEEALSKLHQSVCVNDRCDSRPLMQARGCLLAEDQFATVDVPPADVSAMDGYAVAWQSLESTQILPVSQRIPAGHPPEPLAMNTAARIFTGSVIPAGADTVVLQENCIAEENSVHIREKGEQHQHIRRRGQDFHSGELLLPAGHRLRAQDLGLLASAGIAQVATKKPLRIAILSTGDELVEPGQPLSAGQIYNSNRYTLTGLIESICMEVVDLGHIEDTLIATKNALEKAASNADVIITTGGVSVGEEDHVKPAVEALGQLQLWKLAIKPGKPLAYGHIHSVPFFGLPGNPVAVFVTFLTVVRSYLLRMQGALNPDPQYTQAAAAFTQSRTNTRQEFIRVQVRNGRIHSYNTQDSGVLSSTAWANALAVVPANTAVQEGDSLPVILFEHLGL